MKKIALFLVFTLIFGSCLALVSCNSNSNQGGTNPAETKPAACSHKWKEATTSAPKTCTLCGKTEGEPISAYEALNSDEKEVYRALKNFSSKLGSPSSLKLIDLKVGKTSGNDTTEHVFVKVSANNAYGSPVSEVYVLNYGNLDTGGSSWYNVAVAWPHVGSIAKINAALQEYYDSMGW